MEEVPAPAAQTPAAPAPAAAPEAAPPVLAPAASDASAPAVPAADDAHTVQPAADAAPKAAPAGGLDALLQNPLFLIVIVFWVVWMWMSGKQRKKRKEEEEKRNTLAKGDKVVTIGLMHGVVVASDDKTVTLLTDPKNGAVLTFEKRAVYQILSRAGEEDKK